LVRLDKCLHETGCVHFATLALLPGPPGAPDGAAPSLMFEVVLDDGLDPPTALDIVLKAAFEPLWDIYGHLWPGQAGAGRPARQRWLRQLLLTHATPADCGFVGARDRPVAQIRAEGELLDDAREKFTQLRDSARERPAERDELARQVQRWALQKHGALVSCPAHRSIWRRGVLPEPALALLRALRLGLPALALCAALGWLAAAVAVLGKGANCALFHLPAPAASWIAQHLGAATNEFAIPGLAALALIFALLPINLLARYAEALPSMLMFLGISVLSGGFLVAVTAWRDMSVLICGSLLVVVGLLATLSLALAGATLLLIRTLPLLRAPPHFAWIATLAMAGLTGVSTYVTARWAYALLDALPCSTLGWSHSSREPGTWPIWLLLGSVLVAVMLRTLPIWQRTLRHGLQRVFEPQRLPVLADPGPLHQVHPGIEACEARLIGRQTHMISLTEVRSAWHRFWLRVSLWVVNLLADVYFADGRLGTADGIKFGHWHLLDGGRRLLFCSNYDGTFGGYLDEFIRGASQGINLIWRCTELRPRPPVVPGEPRVDAHKPFPATYQLIRGGCQYEQAFKSYVRTSMLTHLHRFEAYNRSLQDIERATRLRNALCLPADPSKMDQILRALES
ncbi:MAG: hypothetical protein RL722_1720, partial [Pseudomonadota bacterium]